MSETTPRSSDIDIVVADLRAVGDQLRHLHLERLRLMSEAAALARRASAELSTAEIAEALGLAPATVRGFGI